MHNDAGGACTKIDLGASFPAPAGANNAIYEVQFFCEPNDTEIGYRITRLDVEATAFGTITTNIPLSTIFLAPHFYTNNNGVASAVILEFFRYYLESHY